MPIAVEALTERDRAVVIARGLDLADLDDEPSEPGEGDALSPDAEEHILAALVEAEADDRDGKRAIPWREMFPRYRER